MTTKTTKSTKESIKEAATKLFAKKGYSGMTLREIASEVGIKAPSVYAFFEGKDDIFLAVYKETLDGHLSIVESHFKSNQSTKVQLYSILKSAIDFQYQEDLKAKILVRLMTSPPEFIKEDIMKRFGSMELDEYKILSEIFRLGIEKGEIKDSDCHALALSFQCIMDGLFWQMHRHSEEEIYTRLDITFNQFWNGISQ
ncbi:TetR/AcrR family transcriptional regulator [Gottfriedia acidiceleris]|uniref:TetR/AcrR family transcriptional regulator n=1 Tax=Gottfriedia acidiceleris TaxID=371036 RepID=UPI002FFFFB04